MLRVSVTTLALLLAVSSGRVIPSLAADEDEIVFQQNCQLCHTAERVQAKHSTRAEWERIVDKMAALGCPIRTSKKKQLAVIDYLVRIQGPPPGPIIAGGSVTAPAPPAGAHTGPAGRAYVVNEESQDVWAIDVATHKVLAKAKVGKLHHGITPSPDGKVLYVTNMGSNNITMINTETYATMAMGGTGLNPHACAVTPTGRY